MPSWEFSKAVTASLVCLVGAWPMVGHSEEVVSGLMSGEYYCVATASGGVIYDEAEKDWVGTKFQVSNDRLIVRVTATGIFPYGSEKVMTMGYEIEVASPGGPTSTCFSESTGRRFALDIIFMASCTTGLLEYRFNLRALRYMESYAIGFLDGSDAPGNTPSVTVGKCSKF